MKGYKLNKQLKTAYSYFFPFYFVVLERVHDVIYPQVCVAYVI